jgi:hypothetical protein
VDVLLSVPGKTRLTRMASPIQPSPRPKRSGSTKVSRSGSPEPKLPHEHDQSSDEQSPANADAVDVGRQAAADVARGLVDTDRGAVTDRLAREHFKPDPPKRR